MPDVMQLSPVKNQQFNSVSSGKIYHRTFLTKSINGNMILHILK